MTIDTRWMKLRFTGNSHFCTLFIWNSRTLQFAVICERVKFVLIGWKCRMHRVSVACSVYIGKVDMILPKLFPIKSWKLHRLTLLHIKWRRLYHSTKIAILNKARLIWLYYIQNGEAVKIVHMKQWSLSRTSHTMGEVYTAVPKLSL